MRTKSAEFYCEGKSIEMGIQFTLRKPAINLSFETMYICIYIYDINNDLRGKTLAHKDFVTPCFTLKGPITSRLIYILLIAI